MKYFIPSNNSNGLIASHILFMLCWFRTLYVNSFKVSAKVWDQSDCLLEKTYRQAIFFSLTFQSRKLNNKFLWHIHWRAVATWISRVFKQDNIVFTCCFRNCCLYRIINCWKLNRKDQMKMKDQIPGSSSFALRIFKWSFWFFFQSG